MGAGKTLTLIALMWTLMRQGGGLPIGQGGGTDGGGGGGRRGAPLVRLVGASHAAATTAPPPPSRDPGPPRPLIRRAVVACPSSLVDQWGAEFRKWMGGSGGPRVVLVRPGGRGRAGRGGGGGGDDDDGPAPKKRKGRGGAAPPIAAIPSHSGADGAGADQSPDDAVRSFLIGPAPAVLVGSYESLARQAGPLSTPDARDGRRPVGLLICDEAHRLKGGRDGATAAALARICPPARPVYDGAKDGGVLRPPPAPLGGGGGADDGAGIVVLATGTPFQNRLDEVFALIGECHVRNLAHSHLFARRRPPCPSPHPHHSSIALRFLPTRISGRPGRLQGRV